MKTSEMVLLACLTGFTGWLLLESTSMPYHAGQGFGAGFVPLNIAVVSLVLIGLIAFQARKKQASDASGDEITDGAEMMSAWERVRPPVVTMVLLVATVAAMHFGSVLLPLGLLLTAVSAMFLGHSWPRAAVYALGTLAFIYLIFSVWLKIPLT